MARISGRNGRLYVGITSAGTAEPVAFMAKWGASWTTDRYEVTAYGDSNKTFVPGLPDFTITYSGFYDTATAQLYTASQDGVARKFYAYPDNTNTGQYWFGTGYPDFNAEFPVDGAATMNGTIGAASSVAKVG